MENELKEAFAAVHMDDRCAEMIQTKMKIHKQAHTPAQKMRRIAAAAAACLIVATFAFTNPVIVRGVEEALKEIAETVRRTIRRGNGVTIVEEDYVYYNDGYMEIERINGNAAPSSTTSVLLEHPSYLKESDGRLYFRANQENMDITELISMEEPFTYIYDKDGITHYIAVGGIYDPEIGLDSIGYGEWLRNTAEMEEGTANGDLYAGWLGGRSDNYLDNDTGEYYPWFTAAKEELGIPWG